MARDKAENEWLGRRGRVGGWILGSPLRRLLELFVYGNVRGKLLAALALKGDETMADIGCGSGYYTISAARKLTNGRIYCIDGSDQMLAHLRRRVKRLRFEGRAELMNADALDLPLDDESVDVVLTTALLHELASPDAAVREMWRILRPGGRLVVGDFRDTEVNKRRIAGAHGEESRGPMSLDEMSSLLRGAGFEDVDIEPVGRWLLAASRKPHRG